MKTFYYYLLGTVCGVLIVFGFDLAGYRIVQKSALAANQSVRVVTAANVQDIGDVGTSCQNAITRAVAEVSPAVVGVNVISVREVIARHPFSEDPFMRQFFPDQIYRQKVEELGSGFIISPDGYVMTNEHVIHSATQIVVTATTGEKYDAKIVGFDYDSDVALLKIDGKNLPCITFGNSDAVITGEWAIAIGNPLGLFSIHSEPTVTVGVVSATKRDFDRNQEGRLYQNMIQTDAAINRGNSGGPLVDAKGDLIGMNTMIFTENGGGSIGLGFAIPSNKVKELVDQIRTRGTVDRDFWIGLQVQDVNRLIAVSLRLPEARGVVVTDVDEGSPAAKAGIEAPDVILAIDGHKMDRASDLQAFLRNSDLRVGDKLKLALFRNGHEINAVMKLEKKD